MARKLLFSLTMFKLFVLYVSVALADVKITLHAYATDGTAPTTIANVTLTDYFFAHS
jgi:hypothetical protein